MVIPIEFLLTISACSLSYYIGYKVGVFLTLKHFIQKRLRDSKK